MINIIIAIALIIIIIMFDNNFFDFNIDEFSKYNKIDKGNKRTVWVYMKPNISRNTRDGESIGVIKLCVKSIKKHFILRNFGKKRPKNGRKTTLLS